MQSDRVLAVEARDARAVLEGEIDLREIAEGDHAIAAGFDRQVVDVKRIVEGGRDLDGEGPLRGLHFAGCDQLVVVLHNADQFAGGDIIGFQPQRIDQDL